MESKRGAPASLEALARGVAVQFRLRPSRLGKGQAARAWLARHERAGQPTQAAG